ncbi:MAG: hypothetical protein JZU67_06620, partial [Burkholderiaceae bacterium]|nr:hypothetical protein [Burkholderiaceae bacterium]
MRQEQKNQVTAESQLVTEILSKKRLATDDPTSIQKILGDILASHFVNGPDALSLIANEQNIEISASVQGLKEFPLPPVPISTLNEAREKDGKIILIQESPEGDLIRCITPIPMLQSPSGQTILITTRRIKDDQKNRLTLITKGIEDYRQLKHLKKPFKFWLLAV